MFKKTAQGLLALNVLLASFGGSAGEPQASGKIIDTQLQELSGLAVSRRHAEIYWAHNDSFNTPTLFALKPSGEIVARVNVKGAANVDWEDIASFMLDGQPYLALGDIGNNLKMDGDLHIYLLPEPTLDATEVTVQRDYQYRYADGPRDAEGLAVDVKNQQFLIADKGERPAGLYSLPLQGRTYTAERLSDIPNQNASKNLATPLHLSGQHQLTAMDLSADGRRLLLMNYRQLMVYERHADEDWAQTLARPPKTAKLPIEAKGCEAAGWSADGRRILFGNEATKEAADAKPHSSLYTWRP